VVVVVGIAGFRAHGHDWADAVYQTLRLFTINLDVDPPPPAPGPAPAPEPRWWLQAVAFLAALLTARGIAELYREQLVGWLVRFAVHPRVVVFGANERTAALLTASPRPGRRRDAIVVVDPDAQALASITAPRVWKVRGDGRSEASLKRAAVHRAGNVLVITGNNARNSAIAAAVLDLRPPLEGLYAEVEEPGLARALEQGGQRVDVPTTTFSGAGLAAAAVLDTLDADGPKLLSGDTDRDPPTIALFGTGPLVDAMVLELHHRRRIQMLDHPRTRTAVPRVLLFGPDAKVRCGALAAVMGTELQVLDLAPLDVELQQVVELSVEIVRQLARHRPLSRIMVLTPTDLDGGALAISLARHLGRRAEIVLVTESRTTPFGDEICAQTAVSPTLARVRSFRVPDEVYDLCKLAAERMEDRLARALYEVEQPGGKRWASLPPSDREPFVALATEAAKTARSRAAGPSSTDQVMLRRSALVALDAPELAPLRALGFSSPMALARAGLDVDFSSLPALLAAGRTLLATGEHAAFDVWAEVARLRTDMADVGRDLKELPAGSDRADVRHVRTLLLLRQAVLGSTDARLHLGQGNLRTCVRRDPGDPENPIVLLAAPDEDPAASAVRLGPTLTHLPAETVVWATGGLRDVLGDVARDICTPGAGQPGRADALEMWRALVVAGHHPVDLRVAALPGTPADELLLARALGALVGRVETPETTDLNDILLNGAGDIVPLPDDPATIRAFLRPSRWPATFAKRREPLARALHEGYVERQRAQERKPADDEALRPWATLSRWLKESNRAVVDDIPAKLAVLDVELVDRPVGPPDVRFVELVERNLDLLAELEHGRYTAERLLSGWTRGVRDPARFISPHLVPWQHLSTEAKEYDRELMVHLPEVLAKQGLGVRPLTV
jgi:voltage-gated potassium channel Kch